MDQIVDQSDVLLERLLFVMGKGDASAAERAELARDLRIMKGLVRTTDTANHNCRVGA